MGGVEVSFFVQRATIPNKRLSFLHYYTPHMLLILCMRLLCCMSKKNIFSPLKVKKIHVKENRTMRLFMAQWTALLWTVILCWSLLCNLRGVWQWAIVSFSFNRLIPCWSLLRKNQEECGSDAVMFCFTTPNSCVVNNNRKTPLLQRSPRLKG